MQPHEMRGGPADLAKYRFQLAIEDLESAKDNFQNGHLRTANNRAYYSIYHLITAILALDGTAFKRHKDTLAYFNKEYVKTEIFPREPGRRISKAQEVRHASDYDEFYIASKEETERQIESAELLAKAIMDYLDR